MRKFAVAVGQSCGRGGGKRRKRKDILLARKQSETESKCSEEGGGVREGGDAAPRIHLAKVQGRTRDRQTTGVIDSGDARK